MSQSLEFNRRGSGPVAITGHLIGKVGGDRLLGGLELRAKGCRHHSEEVKELFSSSSWGQDDMGLVMTCMVLKHSLVEAFTWPDGGDGLIA